MYFHWFSLHQWFFFRSSHFSFALFWSISHKSTSLFSWLNYFDMMYPLQRGKLLFNPRSRCVSQAIPLAHTVLWDCDFSPHYTHSVLHSQLYSYHSRQNKMKMNWNEANMRENHKMGNHFSVFSFFRPLKYLYILIALEMKTKWKWNTIFQKK